MTRAVTRTLADVYALGRALRDARRYGQFLHSDGRKNRWWLDMRSVHKAASAQAGDVNDELDAAMTLFGERRSEDGPAFGPPDYCLLCNEVAVGSEDHLHFLDPVAIRHFGSRHTLHAKRRGGQRLTFHTEAGEESPGGPALLLVGMSLHTRLVERCCHLAKENGGCAGLMALVDWRGQNAGGLPCAECRTGRYEWLFRFDDEDGGLAPSAFLEEAWAKHRPKLAEE